MPKKTFARKSYLLQYNTLLSRRAVSIEPHNHFNRKRWREHTSPLTCGGIADVQNVMVGHEQETVADSMENERDLIHHATVVAAREPDHGMELMGAGVEGFNAVIQDPQFVTNADLADEGEEASGRLGAVVREEEGTVGSGAAEDIADGAALEDGFRRQRE